MRISNGFISRPLKVTIAAYLILTTLLMGYLIMLASPIAGLASFLTGLSVYQRLFILVAAGGFLGGNIHAMSSMTAHHAAERMRISQLYWFLLRGLLGALYAFLGFIAVRAALFNPDVELQAINLSGLLMLSVLTGIFSDILSQKLRIAVESLLGHKPALEQQLDRIGSSLGTSLLDNFTGMVFVLIRNDRDLVTELREPGIYKIELWFEGRYEYSPTYLSEGRIKGARIDITEGNDVDVVEFRITPKGDGIRVSPGFLTTRTKVTGDATRYYFVVEVPYGREYFDSWVEISQKNRLISSFSLNPQYNSNL